MKNPLQILNILGLVLVIVMNFFSQSDFFPYTVGELGESRAVFFLPAGYVFAIWGLIYLSLIGFAIYQFLHEDAAKRVGWYFLLSCAANVSWLFLFLYNRIWESCIAIVVLLLALLMIYLRLQSSRKMAGRQEYWFLHFPFSIYLGWLTVATVANISAALHDAGFVLSLAGISADVWAVVMMLVAAIFGILFVVLHKDYAYAAVLIWALIGIFARSFSTPAFAPIAELNVALVHNAALVFATGISLAVMLQIGRGFSQSKTDLQISSLS